MKRNIPFVILILMSTFLFAQKEDKKPFIEDFNFESVTNPAFLLLDETPTNINTPDNIRSLALYLSNGFSNSNIAVEVSTYWVLGNKDKSYQEYRGLKFEGNSASIDPFKALERNLTISLGYLDKTFEGIGSNKKVIAFGGNTTLFEFYNQSRTTRLVQQVAAVEKGVEDEVLSAFRQYFIASGLFEVDNAKCDAMEANVAEYYEVATKFLAQPDKRENPLYAQYTPRSLTLKYFAAQCPNIQNFYHNGKNIKPNIRVDGAVGYSILYKEGDFNAATANRFGSWVTVDAAIELNNQKYLHLLGIGKYIDDGFNIDENEIYFSKTYWDYGAKVELDLNRFKLSYEYLRRTGDGEKFRSVGNLTYQLTTAMSITGGFGKDFPADDNLVTLLGINWGLNLAKN
jgi:hypothetical protein